jgi:hypothetical protein
VSHSFLLSKLRVFTSLLGHFRPFGKGPHDFILSRGFICLADFVKIVSINSIQKVEIFLDIFLLVKIKHGLFDFGKSVHFDDWILMV